ncbi:MurR/RpiR family transcriptional regulator [Cohnella lupini]|uniref:RpiR family transcriptional regulator n=1 Tax=Cohnella lupini TaxID=1294267 RepID=A0A3D9I8E3_9BACL|nr:MurR/RpiR family transcriptional regulator [Cohnella lupini]RED58023.1 RpiR family transcriptional regulator [Cohnella lupini]
MREWLNRKNNFTPSDRIIADFIVKNEDKLVFLTESEIGELLQVSVATVSRFWRKIGYKNFKSYKIELAGNLEVTPADKMKNIITEVGVQDIAGMMLSREIDYMQQTFQRLDRNHFDKAVRLIEGAPRVHIHGAGPSASLSELLRFRLNRYGKQAVVLPRSGSELFENLVNVRTGELFVVFGFFRSSPEIEVIQQFAKERGCPIILFTDLTVSEMIDASSCVLYACRGETKQFHSIVAPAALVDALFVALTTKNEPDSVARLNELYEMRKQYRHLLIK